MLDWHPDPAIARTLAMNIDFQGGGWFVSWRRAGRIEERDGRQCLVGPYFFFDVDDAFAFDIDETATLELLFDRRMSDGFNLSYDHAVNPRAKQLRFAPKSGKRWEKVTVALERARFANRKTAGTDFAIGALGAMQPQDRTVNGELALCGLKIMREHPGPGDSTPRGLIELRVLDTDQSPATVRVGLYDAEGRSPLPGDSAVTLTPFSENAKQWPLIVKSRGWPSEGNWVFYVDGSYTARVPAGDYQLVVYKGPEYRMFKRKLTIEPDRTNRVDVELQRWTDMPARGWYSADGHIHIARATPDSNPGVLAFTSAEDIHVSNLLQVSNVGVKDHFRQYAFGPAGQFVDGDHALVSGQESPRSSHRGHSIGLNAPRYVWSRDGYFLYDRIAADIHRDGGLWGYAHVAIDAFNVRYGLALDVPLGAVDFMEVLQMGALNTDYLYDFLNLGYPILPSAGSDFPAIYVAGSDRMYAKVGGRFSPQAWFDAWKSKRSFVTNAPVIEFTVDGDGDGVEYDVAQGKPLRVAARASVNPDMDLLDRVEIVVHGEVVEAVRSEPGAETLELNHELLPRDSLWFAIRAYGKTSAMAHTAPVYIYVDGNRRFWHRTQVADIAARYLGVLRAFRSSAPDLDEDWERFDTEEVLIPTWKRDKAALDERIDRASAAYEELIAQARRTPDQ